MAKDVNEGINWVCKAAAELGWWEEWKEARLSANQHELDEDERLTSARAGLQTSRLCTDRHKERDMARTGDPKF